MFEKPVLGVEDGPSFDVVRSAVQAALAQSSAAKFLKRVDGQRMRVRDFEDEGEHASLVLREKGGKERRIGCSAASPETRTKA